MILLNSSEYAELWCMSIIEFNPPPKSFDFTYDKICPHCDQSYYLYTKEIDVMDVAQCLVCDATIMLKVP